MMANKNYLLDTIINNKAIIIDWRKPNKLVRQDIKEYGISISNRSVIYLRNKYYSKVKHAKTALHYAYMIKKKRQRNYRIVGKTLRQVKVDLEPYMPNNEKITLAKVKKLFELLGLQPKANRSGPVGKNAEHERWN